jgi:multidrug efflux pump
MYLFGFSVNTLTLLAMVLAIGLVVDDAIVVLENIHRHVEEGIPRLEAAMIGAREIAFAVIAMTITLAAVYAPLTFQTGRTGRLFIEFAMALAGAVLVSGFVALTLSPMMCSKLLRHEEKHGKFYTVTERWFQSLIAAYKRGLDRMLHHRMYVVAGYALMAGLAVLLAFALRSELSPIEDRGVIFGFVSAPEGATVTYTSDNVKKLEAIYREMPETARYNGFAGFPRLATACRSRSSKPWSERSRKQQEIVSDLMPKFGAIPGVRAFPTNVPSLGQSPRSRPVEFVIMSQAPFEQLQRHVDALDRRSVEDAGPAEPRFRPAPGQAGAQGAGEPREDQRRGRVRRGRGPHAGDDAGRAPGHALQEGRRAVRRDRADRRQRPPFAHGHLRDLRAGQEQRDGEALEPPRGARIRCRRRT